MPDPIREALAAAKEFLFEEQPTERHIRHVAALLTAALALLDKPHPDTERLDWLEGELDREIAALHAGRPTGRSLFRANRPIKRAAIDAARFPACPECHNGSCAVHGGGQ